MPRRRRRRSRLEAVMSLSPSNAEHGAVGRRIGVSLDEIVERPLRHPDDVVADETGALGGAVLGVFQAAFPLQHGPAVEVVAGQLGEDALEIDLSVTGRAEAAGATDPRL